MNGLSNILNSIQVQDLARSWLKEDCPNFDIGSIIAADDEVVAKIYCKSSGVLAGIPFANAVFDELSCSPNWFFKEGENLSGSPKTEVAYVGGKAKNILLAERTVLNVLSRCSGVATIAKRLKSKLINHGWKGRLAGTRKTTPGFRLVEKYGLLVGGVSTHRYDLSHMVMLKDNHVKLFGGRLKETIDSVRTLASFCTKIEIECGTHDEVKEAACCDVDIIMLDNFKPEDVIASSKWLKQHAPQKLVEVSGGIDEENVLDYAINTVDIMSMSCLVQGYETVDFSMKILTSVENTQ